MKNFSRFSFGIVALMLAAAFTAQADEQQPGVLDGLSVEVSGTLGTQGTGGSVGAEYQGEHYILSGALGGIGAFGERAGEARLTGRLDGVYCFSRTSMGLCLGGRDLLHSDGNRSQLGVSPIGIGYFESTRGAHLFFGPRYAYVLDHDRDLSMHMAGVRMDLALPLTDSLLFEALLEIGAALGVENTGNSAPLEDSGTGMYARAGLGFRVDVTDNLAVRLNAIFTEASSAERRVELPTAGSSASIAGTASVVYAF